MLNVCLTKLTMTSCWAPPFYITLKHIEGMSFHIFGARFEMISVPKCAVFTLELKRVFYPDEDYI